MMKDDIIKQYYDEDYVQILNRGFNIDSTGACDFYAFPNETFINGYEIFNIDDQVKVRPLGLKEALENLENNNGWITIKNEKDLPKENLDCWFISNGKVYQGKYNYDLRGFESYHFFDMQEVTHYKKIQKPELPIY